MRTTIEIDDRLMKEAMEATGLKTKRAVVIHALKKLVRQGELVEWMGDGEKGFMEKVAE